MADIFGKAKRSTIMSVIRSRGNRETELRLIALMCEHGIIGWRRNTRVFGKPDFVFRAANLAVIVDGCFWHGCPCSGSHSRWGELYERVPLARQPPTATVG